MWFYIPFPVRVELPEAGKAVTWGIAGIQKFTCVERIEDVSPNWRRVLWLAVRCTVGRLDASQLADVVEDAVG